ncbi:unnamed protein product [Symbiodinium sp. CCMP2592]|nr:unnamed protein product [Symbiodinium sp. CCMP2592]
MAQKLALLLALQVLTASAAVTSLTFGQDIDYPPYASKNATSGELTGFGVELVKAMNTHCSATLNITVVETRWSNCWSSAGGGTLGALLDNGTLDACMTYTHTQGIRNDFADFSWGILDVNKAAGLLTLLENGMPKLDGHSDLNGKTIVDVGGWAPTADGLDFVTNKCLNQKYSSNYTLVVGNGNDEAMTMLRNGTADAMFVYADQAKNYQCDGSMVAAWDCTLWQGFGTEYAYVQTGQFGYVVNGTTLALSKKGSGVPEAINSCLAEVMATEAYYDACVKYDLVDSCYANSFFPSSGIVIHEYNKETDEHSGDCSSGYCPCPSTSTQTAQTSLATGLSIKVLAGATLSFLVALLL